MRIHLFILLLVLPLLAACVAPASAPANDPGLAPPSMGSGTGASTRVDGAVDYSCSVDADCAVKDVGNCCGYYPACVNRDSPTFPEQVRERCEAEGMMGVCGFPEITACQCVENRCESAGNGAQPHRIEIK